MFRKLKWNQNRFVCHLVNSLHQDGAQWNCATRNNCICSCLSPCVLPCRNQGSAAPQPYRNLGYDDVQAPGKVPRSDVFLSPFQLSPVLHFSHLIPRCHPFLELNCPKYELYKRSHLLKTEIRGMHWVNTERKSNNRIIKGQCHTENAKKFLS